MFPAKPLASLAAAFLLLGTGCQRGHETTSPASVAAEPAANADAVRMRYAKQSLTLAQTGRFEMTQSGAAGSSELAFEVDNEISWSPKNERLEVAWDVVDVRDVQMQGSLSHDASMRDEIIEEAAGVIVMDDRGVVDEVATQAQAKNTAQLSRFESLQALAKTDEERRKLQSWALVVFSAGSVAALPELPAEALAPGQTVLLEDEEEVALGGLKVPMETETRYTLVKIDDATGERIAKIRIESEASGATETPQGFLAVDATRDGVLHFNLDRQLPVRLEAKDSQTFSQGERAMETTTVLRTSWQPAAEAAAAKTTDG